MIKFTKADKALALQEVKNSNFVSKAASKAAEEVKNVPQQKEIAETATSQSAKVIHFDKDVDNARKNINASAANNAYANVAKQEPISEVIKDKYGQTILVTSDVDNIDDVIVTYMNTGKTFKCPAKELPEYDIHIGQ